jgi:mycothiol system anti-sigma-R factor
MSDCKDALHQLYDFLDGELTDHKRAAIQHHLDTCQPCAEPYDFEAELRLVVRKKCAETVPDSLMAKIRKALDAEPLV